MNWNPHTADDTAFTFFLGVSPGKIHKPVIVLSAKKKKKMKLFYPAMAK